MSGNDRIEKSAVTVLAAANGYIVFNWYVKSLSEKSVIPTLDVFFGIAAFIALDLAMLAVVFSKPNKDRIGWVLTILTAMTASGFSGGIAYHLYGDALHAAFAVVQFMVSIQIAYNRYLKYGVTPEYATVAAETTTPSTIVSPPIETPTLGATAKSETSSVAPKPDETEQSSETHETPLSETAPKPATRDAQTDKPATPNVTADQKLFLRYIAANDTASLRDIAANCGADKSSATISRWHRALEDAGVVSRNGTWKVHIPL